MEIATKATYSCLPLKYALGSKDTMLTINREKTQKEISHQILLLE